MKSLRSLPQLGGLGLASLLLISLLINSAASAAVSSGQAKVELTGSVVRAGRTLSLEEAGQVRPGEIIGWNIRVANSGGYPQNNISAFGRIPEGTRFVPGSARGDGSPTVKYSIDGGKNYSARPMVTVTGTDGVKREVPASPNQYTDIQFTWDGNINPNQVVNASYRTRVR